MYGNTRIESKKVYVGEPSRSNLGILKSNKLLPVASLFNIDAESPYYREESKTSIFYAESWALTHYLISRDWHEHTHRIQDFFELLRKGTGQREAAERTIGDLETLQKAL